MEHSTLVRHGRCARTIIAAALSLLIVHEVVSALWVGTWSTADVVDTFTTRRPVPRTHRSVM
jgi:hypothetical protein